MKVTLGFDKYAMRDKPEIIRSDDGGIIIIHFLCIFITILRGWYAEQYEKEKKCH